MKTHQLKLEIEEAYVDMRESAYQRDQERVRDDGVEA
jgi:hypothetical protein